MTTAVGTSDGESPDDMAVAAHQEDIAALRVAESVDPVKYVAVPGDDHDQVVADVVKQANAGAALAYALYHVPVAWWTAEGSPVPDAVIRAYMKACRVYGIGHHS